MRTRHWLILGILVPLLLASTRAISEEARTEGLLNKLLAPGPLIEGHKKLEGNECLQCHTPREGIPDNKCLDCHKDLRTQVDGKSGFHGLAKKACIECHNDHQGREFDSTQVDKKTFDHQLTGYLLEGKHAELDCAKCHIEKRSEAKKVIRPDDLRFLGLKTTCVGCHKKEDPHAFNGDWAKKDCNSCHGAKTWKDGVRFQHEKDAKYRLEGKHAEVSCAKCHRPEGKSSVYHWDGLAKSQCLTCHEDFHKANLGPKFKTGKCTQCHVQSTWKVEHFDHKVTGSPLAGKHASIDCVSCHKQGVQIAKADLAHFRWTGLQKDCATCHKDSHQFGSHRSKVVPAQNSCPTCHTEATWKETRFDHNRDTRFRIGGKHEGLECIKCHVSVAGVMPPMRQYSWQALPTRTCESCHASPHKKTFSAELLSKKCTECHLDAGWNVTPKGGGFDHSTTRFKLDGKHRDLSCRDCHGAEKAEKKQVFKFPSSDNGFCVDCHKNVHVGQFSAAFAAKSCAECHGTSDFVRRKSFDHSLTRFKVDGGHEKLECAKCHVPTREVLETKPPRYKARFLWPESAEKRFCESCHQNVHQGQFHSSFATKSCASCHSTKDFTRRLEFDHARTSFALRGKHVEAKCDKCHIPSQESFPAPSNRKKAHFLFPEIPVKDCATCHKDPHEGKFGKKCSDCHREDGWKSTQDFHKDFTLTGVHFSLECAECHKTNRKLAGTSENCQLCHQKDDIHAGTLPNCGSCHLQHFWEVSRFRHSLTNFPLRGVHRTLDCFACHDGAAFNGPAIYKGAPTQCVSCHLKDAQAVTSPVHGPSYLSRSCDDCHNQFSFR